MGQQSSKSHAPLTFGYINHNTQHQHRVAEEGGTEDEAITFEQYLNNKEASRVRINTPDFVLDNPHLYKLEFTCQHCSPQQQKTTAAAASVVVAEQQVNTPCQQCSRKNKRLSLVRRDLASDLNYIDETYYPNIVHYYEEGQEENGGEENGSSESYLDQLVEDDADTLRDEVGWSKLTFGEVTPNLPKRLASSSQLAVDLSGKSLIKLSSSIGYLDNLTKLDISDNQMINLPKAIGQLKNLRIFNASKNQLESIPESITSLKKLKAINLSHNRLDYLPKGMGTLPNLIILILNHNQLTNLPRELANLNDLITLNVSNNPLKTIPAEIATLKSLRKLIAEDCAFEQEFVHDLKHDPPSLFEICARNIISSDTPLPPSLASSHIADYFKREQLCSFCYGPYFDSFVTRGRFIERTGRQILALDYKLCCAHWTNEEDRIQAMFSTPYYKQSYLQPQHVESVSIPSAAALEDISTIPLSSPMTTTASLTGVETQQVDYFGTIRSSNNRSSRRGNNEILFIPTYSSEDMLPSPLISPTDSFTDSMDSFTAYSGPLSPSSPTIISSQQQHHPQQRPAFNNTNTSSSSSTAAAVATRPRSSSTSSSSLLRIHAMHQQLQHNISAALLRKQQRQQQEILGGNSGTGGDVVLPFASLNGRQSEEADMILLSRNQLITTSLDGEVTAEPSSTRPQLQQSSSNGSSSVRSKKSGKAAIKEGFASLGAKLGGGSRKGARDRSETF